MTHAPSRGFRLFSPSSWTETRRIVDILRTETVGGALLLTGAMLGMVWANSPWSETYEGLRAVKIGPAALHLDLSLATWAADGLLAIFFFVAGLELKREFVAGDLRDPRRAAIPIAAAVAGVLVPAAIYLLITSSAKADAAGGWAIPTATDIAFALAVLAVIGRHLPAALRTFLLTLAVVDDVLAIMIIALFYTDHLTPLPLLAALGPLAAFALLVRRGVRAWWLLLPLAAITWSLIHASGVHATLAGVLLAFAVPVTAGARPGPGLAEHFEHRFRPLSASVAVPLFAFLSAGVPLGGLDGLAEALTNPVALAIMAGLVIGKPVGVMAATWLMARFTQADLDENLTWVDVLGLSILAGIGFTVSLLIGELAFGIGSERDSLTKIAVLTGSLAAALLAAWILRLRNNTYRRIEQAQGPFPEG
ncbi:Na+/H+ antiporter NhaA [Nonomuraea rubra]|uniref:Na+/H+ antiporter NhaA n=1 Tax=Nonomuraea rubra TaxID=46180 RepID=UPI0033FBB138